MNNADPRLCQCTHFKADHTGKKCYSGNHCEAKDCACLAWKAEVGYSSFRVCSQCSTFARWDYRIGEQIERDDPTTLHTTERCQEVAQNLRDALPQVDRSRGGLRWGYGETSATYDWPDKGGFRPLYGNVVDIVFDYTQNKELAHNIATDLIKAGVIPDEEAERGKLHATQHAAVIKSIVGPKKTAPGACPKCGVQVADDDKGELFETPSEIGPINGQSVTLSTAHTVERCAELLVRRQMDRLRHMPDGSYILDVEH